MVSTKDLREIFEDVRDDASKRASDAIHDAVKGGRIPQVRLQQDQPSSIVYFGLGIILGAALGVILGAIMTPYRGAETRQKIADQVQKARTRAEETNGQQRYESPTPTQI